MKNVFLFISFFTLIFCCFINAQTKIEADIEIAYQNAKKGVYWALDNIPEKKAKLENDLIAEDKLYAKVKLDKEIFGVKVESTGYYNSNEVTITIYKSDDSLVKEGYLKK
ncbi:MAG: hypothetical protein A2V93_04405 [Ignavibacteria bacterium RBG_16_34_14]|nr:MAG: hypothetical protein A2V93_04405 [Ignavibacteria bacterium RBG_16_34_14]